MSQLSICLSLFVAIVVCHISALADDPVVQLPPQQVAAIRDAVRVEMERQQLVGLAVGILQNGEVVFTQGYGYAQLEQRTLLTPQTVINWASNSKPVMAVLALQLVEQGRLDLDADVRQYVPEFPEKTGVVTTRHLLCHQSGLPHYTNGQVIPSPGRRTAQQELDPLQAIKRFDQSPLMFPPGAKMDYSSHAYVLLSAVVQRAGKAPIAQQLQDRIVTPLRLASFQMDLPTNFQPNWATGYELNDQQQLTVTAEVSHAWKHGAGAYKSHVADFSRWAEALLNQRLLGEKTQRLMWTPQQTNMGKTTEYGLGVSVEGTGERLKISHNGSQQETKTRMVLYPRQRHGMVVMSNCGHADPGAISTAIYRALSETR